ncbi:MAG TPA: RHS repeat-associated core domain-containing protein [Nitrospira sp.]|nr:RHS repeat-associated core domain-containing protein [Nitrospira sp.]
MIASTAVPISTPVATSTLFYHQDGLGTVTELTDSNGAVTKAYAYDAYGTILESPGTVDQPYTYTGREFDSESGLYYYRARYYDATTGRFSQRDPIGRAGGINYYEYALGNPVRHFDPYGLKSEIVIWAPVGIGQSSFGHVSTDINGTTYSFGPNGMTTEPTSVYRQRNSFRDSLGLDLNLTPEQENALMDCLGRSQPDYNFLTNNCGGPAQKCLNWLGYDVGQLLLPSQISQSLVGMGLVRSTTFYPGATSTPSHPK